MKSFRYLILTALVLAALLSSGILSGMQDGALAQAQAECTVTVQPGESIQAAIDAAAEGDVICLAEGTWEENVKIERSLTLRGAGQEETIIEGEKEGYPVIWIGASEEATQTVSVKLEGLGITKTQGCCADLAKNICPDGALIQGSTQVVVYRSSFSENFGNGLTLRGFARAVIRNSSFSENFNGIELADSAQATIIGSSLSENYVTGLRLGGSTGAAIRDSSFLNNLNAGIRLRGSAWVTSNRSLVEGNGGCGILSYSRGEVLGEENRITDNGNDLCGNLPGSLRTPLVKATEMEITYPNDHYANLQEAVDALLPGGRLVLGAGKYEAGITVTKPLRIEGGNKQIIVLKSGSIAAPVLSVVSGGDLELTGLKVTGGVDGLLLGADGRATVTDVSFTDNGDGIALEGSAEMTISDSSAAGNNGEGILIFGMAQATINNSTISENTWGLGLLDSARAVISSSSFSKNEWEGILLKGFTQTIISNSTIYENGGDGIWLLDSARATIEGNTIINNGGYGVSLYERPCFDTDAVFTGHVRGRANTIPGPDEPEGNGKGAVCPSSELEFLMTEAGGEYP